MRIRIAGIVNDSIVDGPGLRFTVFVQGCPHRCPGCHNPQTWDLEGGREIDTEELLQQIKKNPLIDGITFSGGEPFLWAKELAELGQWVHSLGLTVMTYTGYTWEQLTGQEAPENADRLLKATDILVDGPFKQEEKSLDLLFRGSSNQRLIHVQKSLKAGKAIQCTSTLEGEIIL